MGHSWESPLVFLTVVWMIGSLQVHCSPLGACLPVGENGLCKRLDPRLGSYTCSGLSQTTRTVGIVAGTAICDGNSRHHKAFPSAGQRSSKADPSDAMAVMWPSSLHYDLHVFCTWGFLKKISVLLGILDCWRFSYESFMPSPRSPASKLPQESPEHMAPAAFRDMPYVALLEDLPCALEVMAQNKDTRALTGSDSKTLLFT